MTAFSFPWQASAKGNKVAASIVKLAKKFGMSASELADQVEFCVPQPYMFEPVHHAFEPVSVETVRAAPQETIFGVASPPHCVASQPVCLDSACVNTPVLNCIRCCAPLPVPASRAAVPPPFHAPVPVQYWYRVDVAGIQSSPAPMMVPRGRPRPGHS